TLSIEPLHSSHKKPASPCRCSVPSTPAAPLLPPACETTPMHALPSAPAAPRLPDWCRGDHRRHVALSKLFHSHHHVATEPQCPPTAPQSSYLPLLSTHTLLSLPPLSQPLLGQVLILGAHTSLSTPVLHRLHYLLADADQPMKPPPKPSLCRSAFAFKSFTMPWCVHFTIQFPDANFCIFPAVELCSREAVWCMPRPTVRLRPITRPLPLPAAMDLGYCRIRCVSLLDPSYLSFFSMSLSRHCSYYHSTLSFHPARALSRTSSGKNAVVLPAPPPRYRPQYENVARETSHGYSLAAPLRVRCTTATATSRPDAVPHAHPDELSPSPSTATVSRAILPRRYAHHAPRTYDRQHQVHAQRLHRRSLVPGADRILAFH
ncbi:hypothetical protein B0H13DRAFT_2537120, partial [Mycena leptocephala]